jgi:putative toxin-antitoxin system antitoxin component (TIGR02293 family)
MEAAAESRDIARYRDLIETRTAGPYSYTVLLGFDYSNWPAILKAVEKGFPWRAFERLVRNMGLPAIEVAEMIGIPKRTLARRKAEKRFLAEESDRLLRVARVFAETLKLYGGDRDGAAEWLTYPQRALAAVPLELLRSEFGAIRHGMFL